ncbi:MAG: UDP-N-acetylmuramoyl-L-alanine--D-glutamate ligase, partial [Spirochaetaceae bacterium]|nr:UDP-N-acetylmuramoyl-L-alanine--D-glutamate ligase [Spirochaetaceae bacterium]
LNGGGLATARFLAERGAEVTVTDMKDEAALAASIAALGKYKIRYVLGRHELEDFSGADLVVKNPAVRPDSPYLLAAAAVETDLSLFLRLSKAPILAVTGSKGKSTVSSALYHGLAASGAKAFLGGNITVSPLSFIDETGPGTPVVLELSSWQLADLKGLGVLKPRVAVLTSMMPDHMNRYSSMEEYMADKRLIYADQDASCYTVANRDDSWNRSFAMETRGTVRWYADAREEGLPGAWLEGPGGRGLYSEAGSASGAEEILPAILVVPGRHQRKNLLGAALALRLFGLPASTIASSLATFPGVEHRLEFFAENEGIRWYNDSAATIPQAVAAALSSLETPIVLITGGTDKNLDFEPVRDAYRKPKAIVLLAGSGTDKLKPLLDADGIATLGPYKDLDQAVREARRLAERGDAVLLSPGCTSFGMFLHEFDRGNKFKETVRALLGTKG